MNKFFALLVVLMLGVALSGCGGSKKTKLFKKDINYKSSRKGKTLEVPPDLNSPNRTSRLAVPSSGTATLSNYQGQRSGQVLSGSGVLPKQTKTKFVRNGDKYWVVIQGSPRAVWSSVREFWLQKGFLLAIDNPTIGIMETDWAENRAKIAKGFIRKTIGKVFSGAYSTGTRDRFRIRLERGLEPGTVELYLTHKGLLEQVQGTDLDPTGTVWKPSKRDIELEVEMLKRIMVHVGVSKRKVIALAKNIASRSGNSIATRLGSDDKGPFVDVSADFSRAWRIVGLGLDRTGFNVVDRNRSKGVYFVKYNDPERSGKKRKGLFKIFRRKKKKGEITYQVKIVSENNSSQVRVYTKDGSPEKSSTAKRIMTLLKEHLK